MDEDVKDVTVQDKLVAAGDVKKFITSTDTLGREQPRKKNHKLKKTQAKARNLIDIYERQKRQ